MVPKSERFEMRMEGGLLDRLDSWAFAQSDRPSRSEAARRLIEAGLEHSDGNINPSKVEMLSMWMLSEVLKQLPGDEGRDVAELTQRAFYGGHYWALDWELTGILHDHVDRRHAVSDVVNALDMWNFIERGFEQLSSADKKKVEDKVGPTGKDPKFVGFDGNNETEHMGIAQFLVNELGRFERFKSRSFNSHMPKVQRYKSMYREFEPIRARLIDRELSTDEIIKVLNAE